MYESPIEKVVGEIQSQIIKQDDEDIMYAVKQAVGYSVDKNELIKALKYDREQYEKGYRDGLNADKWIPVSERLPKLDELDTTVWKQKIMITGYLSFDNKKELFVSEAFINDVINNSVHDTVVIAWMSLPKPYEPQESEE